MFVEKERTLKIGLYDLYHFPFFKVRPSTHVCLASIDPLEGEKKKAIRKIWLVYRHWVITC